MPPRPRPTGGIERSCCPYVHPSVDHGKIFVQGRISRPINGSKLIFHMRVCLCLERSGCPSIDHVKIFVQGRISRPINGSKLIFHMRMYLYDTSRNIQEPWPHDLYFTVHWLRTLTRLSRLRFLSKVESQDLLMVASWYFIWWCISMRPAGIYKSHDLLTYISWSTDFELWPDYQG